MAQQDDETTRADQDTRKAAPSIRPDRIHFLTSQSAPAGFNWSHARIADEANASLVVFTNELSPATQFVLNSGPFEFRISIDATELRLLASAFNQAADAIDVLASRPADAPTPFEAQATA
jgi:hypothetical protein